MKFNHVLGQKEPYHQGFLNWAKAVEEKTKAGLKIEVFHSAQLGVEEDILEQIRAGANIGQNTDSARMGNYVPGIACLNGPYFAENLDEVGKLNKAPTIKGFLDELANKHGFKVLSFSWVQGYRHFFTNTPILKPEDLKGLRIRTPVPCEVDYASEFRYRHPLVDQRTLTIYISQSGETADTLAALRFARAQKQHILVVVNVPESSMAREADIVLRTKAGPEVGVASTKAFTTQPVVLASLVIGIAAARGAIDRSREAALCQALTEVPSRANDVLVHDQALARLAEEVAAARDVLYLGRGTGYPIALEGALKVKESSHIHAQGYAAGEMARLQDMLLAESTLGYLLETTRQETHRQAEGV